MMAVASAAVPTWKTLEDAASRTGVSVRTLRRWLAAGQLTAYRIAGDRRRYVDLDEIKKLREPRPVTRTDG